MSAAPHPAHTDFPLSPSVPPSVPPFLPLFTSIFRAGLEYLNTSGQQPHILHLHEWQTAAVSMLYWEVYSQLGLYRPRVVLTIHNLDNTGECRQDEFAYAGQCGTAGGCVLGVSVLEAFVFGVC